MQLTKIQHRQLIDQAVMLGRDPRFSSASVEAFKYALVLGIRHFDPLIDSKRTAYNFAIGQLLQKYGLAPDNLYENLDSIWFSVRIERRNAHWRTWLPIGVDSWVYMTSTWDRYKVEVEKLVKDVADKSLDAK